MTSDTSRPAPVGNELPTSPSGQVGARTNRPGLQLRAACDSCNKSKTKCPGGNPCPLCQSSGIRCHYSVASRMGRPKGSKNKRTLMQEMQENLSNGDSSRSWGQFQPDGTAQAHNANLGSDKPHQSMTPWPEGSQGQQQQLKQQLFPSGFDHGPHNTGTTIYGGADGDDSPFGMDNRDLFSMLDHDLLMDAMTDDMSDFGHLMSQAQPTQMTVGLIKLTISARDPPQTHKLTNIGHLSTDSRILNLNVRPTRRLFRQTRPLSPNIIRCNAAPQ